MQGAHVRRENFMSELFELCKFTVQPVDKKAYVSRLKELLKEYPATLTTKDLENPENESSVGTSLLHQICQSLPETADQAQVDTAIAMIDTLFYNGANWMMLDDDNLTPGCIALQRKLPQTVYDRIVTAGVRAEVMLRRLTEDAEEENPPAEAESNDKKPTLEGDTSCDQAAYLRSELEYTSDSLVTGEKKDGVMMEWERPIMQKSADIICPEKGLSVLNIGFGMGIIDTMLQEKNPAKHYICEAHPKVLAKLRADGWYDKPNVVVLEGRWQDTLPKLLEEEGVQLDGIYYDTFSEHYSDLVEFFDQVVALLKPTGIFSFFNGLGADRKVCYDVYKQVVEVDVQDYGMSVEYIPMPVNLDKSTWNGIRHEYWTLSEYYLPKITFVDF